MCTMCLFFCADDSKLTIYFEVNKFMSKYYLKINFKRHLRHLRFLTIKKNCDS